MGILERLLKLHFTPLPRSGNGLEFRLWSLLTLSKPHLLSSVVIGTLTLGCFSEVLTSSALLPTLSQGRPCCSAKCLQEPCLGLTVRCCKRKCLFQESSGTPSGPSKGWHQLTPFSKSWIFQVFPSPQTQVF